MSTVKTEHNVTIKAKCWNPNCGQRRGSWTYGLSAEEQGFTPCVICNDTGKVKLEAVMEMDLEECP